MKMSDYDSTCGGQPSPLELVVLPSRRVTAACPIDIQATGMKDASAVRGRHDLVLPEDEPDGGMASKLSWENDGMAELQYVVSGGPSPACLSTGSPGFEVITDTEVQLAPALVRLRKYNEGDLENAFTQLSIPGEDEVTLPSPNAVAEMEAHTEHIAESLHHMLGAITATLHAVSGKTRVCVEAHGGAVDDIGENVDETIQMMHRLMGHCNTISHSMQYIYALAEQLRSIKATLAVFEKMVK